jgi:N-methylhydantoinase A/oxoprolinase/acetone carboxylase beta subunit/N-methylhydantoinase B/oxoprolinase/acetone carboxylase alpha subunit
MLLGVDVGGTFTDAVLVHGDGTIATAKVPSTPEDQSLGVLAAVSQLLGGEQVAVTRFAHGMTVATNALLEGKAARTALLVTEGFTDLVALGRQARPQLYRLCAAPPQPLVPRERRFGVPERTTHEGPLRVLAATAARQLVARVAASEPEAIAVVLLHSYAHPQHERQLGELLARALPDVHVSLSHELVGTFREYERAASTEIDAALSPLLAGYLRSLAAAARSAALPEPQIMQSSGGLTDVRHASSHAALTVLSGPAGGVGGALMLARLAGERDLLCLDMGGTSCDVCLVLDGEVTETAQRTIAGRPLALPSLDIHTVGAGGGSIAWRDAGGALRVGPQSAGAQPGPACYGLGGHEPTVTDANLLLGRLPASTPLAGGLELDLDAARAVVATLAQQLDIEPEACAEGIVRIAELEMLRALRVVSVQRGIDPRRLTLLAFGGAGPLHAVSLARELGISRVLCPSASGVLSALGLAAAAPRRDAAKTVLLAGEQLDAQRLDAERETLCARASAELDSPSASEIALRVTAEMRYVGQSFELAVDASLAREPQELVEAFELAHEQRYGYREAGARVELVTLRVSAFGAPSKLALAAPDGEPTAHGSTQLRCDGEQRTASLFSGVLPSGTQLAGPAVCLLGEATLFVPPGWSGAVDASGTISLDAEATARIPNRRGAAGSSVPSRRRRPDADADELDPIELQVMSGALAAACEEMGATLIRAAHSPNIKERRDCSTALFDARGEMTMQAEHIPVHLGSMPDAVAAVLGRRHEPGRSWILNDPFAGGTHLPDITVVTPVFAAADVRSDDRLIGFAASRAHHSDVGGATPGSMPADSVELEDEGVVISPQPLEPGTIERLVSQMRGPAQRRADLRAQLAANALGARRLAELAQRLGVARLRAGTDAVLAYAERRMRGCIAALPDGLYEAEDFLEARDGDLVLRLRARVRGDGLELDFAGSAPQHAGNLNCPLAVTRSACAFAVRVLTDPDIPPSTGALRPIAISAPRGSILNAEPGAAVAAGNVETSSRVADLVLAAFGRALGQGTMNNLTLGDERFAYYETIGGGQGACPDADGPSAVHVAMSNTLNTPIEALERETPLRVTAYELRRGSGGSGTHRGGDGVVRELEALREVSYSLITERRRHAPRGAAGGRPGACGRNLLYPAATQPQNPSSSAFEPAELPPKVSGVLSAGERLRIETPGGGGDGPPAA